MTEEVKELKEELEYTLTRSECIVGVAYILWGCGLFVGQNELRDQMQTYEAIVVNTRTSYNSLTLNLSESQRTVKQLRQQLNSLEKSQQNVLETVRQEAAAEKDRIIEQLKRRVSEAESGSVEKDQQLILTHKELQDNKTELQDNRTELQKMENCLENSREEAKKKTLKQQSRIEELEKEGEELLLKLIEYEVKSSSMEDDSTTTIMTATTGSQTVEVSQHLHKRTVYLHKDINLPIFYSAAVIRLV